MLLIELCLSLVHACYLEKFRRGHRRVRHDVSIAREQFLRHDAEEFLSPNINL
jgi:hypothetical protein